MQVHSFALHDVRLAPGPEADRQALTLRYLTELDPERLLHSFRVTAGLGSAAAPYGGWESPDCGLRGHFVGHYLSACAQMYASTGDEDVRDRAGRIVEGFRVCQDAAPDGYLSAFPRDELDRIEQTADGAWAPYYTLHKLLAGLVEVRRHCGSAAAIEVAARLAGCIADRIGRLSPAQIERMCRTDRPNPTNEFGGIAESLLALHAYAPDPRWMALVEVFRPAWFVEPLLRADDRLTGLHANTHIPIVLAMAAEFERTGAVRLRDGVRFFWEKTALERSYVNGASSGPHPEGLEKSKGGEHWPHAGRLAGTLTPKINESCVTHNMLRVTDALFRWTAEPRYADFRERAMCNHVLAMQHPASPGRYLYSHPLAACSCKTYGNPHDAFWCCYGTTLEAFARLGDGVWHHDDRGLWIAQGVPSDLHWTQRQLRAELRRPDAQSLAVTMRPARPTDLSLRIRVPAWCDAPSATLNGQEVGIDRGGYLHIERTWQDGDRVELRMPWTLRTETLPGDPERFAILRGPNVLAALTDRPLDVRCGDNPLACLEPDDAPRDGLRLVLADGTRVPLVPLNQVVDEPFGVYCTRVD
jgi:hypothetical protein